MSNKRNPASRFLILAILLTGISASLVSYRAKQVSDEVWKTLGINASTANKHIKASFLNGYLQYYGVKNFKSIAVGDREKVAEDMLQYTKTYINSAEFQQFYAKHRIESKPTAPEATPLRTYEEIQKDEIAKLEKSIKETEKSMKEIGGEVAKSLEPLVAQMKSTIKTYQSPNCVEIQYIMMGEKAQQENNETQYQQSMKTWKEEFPEDYKAFVAKKLKKMLDLTNGIDYNAQLEDKYGKKRFVNKSYESKSREWKQGFRAGKSVTEKARAFAQKWLAELK